MTDTGGFPAIRLSTLSRAQSTPIDVIPSARPLTGLREKLDLLALRKVRLTGALIPEAELDWRLVARLGATVVQPCVVTTDPVTTRIETDVTRRFVADFAYPSDAEVEMPEDDSVEALPRVLDLALVVHEALAIALPDYPRALDTDAVDETAAPPGAAPFEDAHASPFAVLKQIKPSVES